MTECGFLFAPVDPKKSKPVSGTRWTGSFDSYVYHCAFLNKNLFCFSAQEGSSLHGSVSNILFWYSLLYIHPLILVPTALSPYCCRLKRTWCWTRWRRIRFWSCLTTGSRWNGERSCSFTETVSRDLMCGPVSSLKRDSAQDGTTGRSDTQQVMIILKRAASLKDNSWFLPVFLLRSTPLFSLTRTVSSMLKPKSDAGHTSAGSISWPQTYTVRSANQNKKHMNQSFHPQLHIYRAPFWRPALTFKTDVFVLAPVSGICRRE